MPRNPFPMARKARAIRNPHDQRIKPRTRRIVRLWFRRLTRNCGRAQGPRQHFSALRALNLLAESQSDHSCFCKREALMMNI